jgi:hypothetical protein
MSEGLGIIAKFLFIIAVVVIAHGGWQVRSGNADMGKMSIVGGLLLGLAVLITEAQFKRAACPPSRFRDEQGDRPDARRRSGYERLAQRNLLFPGSSRASAASKKPGRRIEPAGTN